MLGSAKTRRYAAGVFAVAAVGSAIAAAPATAATPIKTANAPHFASAATVNRAASLHSAVDAVSARPLTASLRASQDGGVDVGDFGQWYFDSAHGYGSLYDTSHNDNYLQDNHFITAGAGQHTAVANNAEFVWNRDPHTSVVVCTGLNYTGTCGVVGPNVAGNLTSAYRDNLESLYWNDSSN